MHPTLASFQLPWIGWLVQVHSYPFSRAVALVVFAAVALRAHARDGGDVGAGLDAVLAGVCAGLAGASLVGLWTSGTVVHLDGNALSRGHRSAYGGLLFGGLAAVWTARFQAIDVAAFLDAAAPGLALGAFVCRIGCFLAGCCWGRPTTSWWGVRFPVDHPGMPAFLSGQGSWGLHPTQLYFAAAALTTAAAVEAMRRFGIGRPGERFAVAAALYATSTFAIEFLRADPGRWFALGLSHSQWISIGILVVAAVRWVVKTTPVPRFGS